MPSLRQLLAAHAPLLVLDAASARVQAGWFASGGEAGGVPSACAGASEGKWATSDEEAGIGVFRCVEKLGAEVGLDVGAAGALVFCDGPGSILGIRTVATALRTWGVVAPRPVFAYHSLAVVAEAIGGEGEVEVIADARRELWHAYRRGGKLRRVPAAELAGDRNSAALVTPENFRHWSAPPAGVRTVSYALAELLALPRVADADLFRATDAPDAFLHEEPNYVTWTPQIHRAPN